MIRLESRRVEALKILAVLSMSADHMNAVLLDRDVFLLSAIGRLAFPLFAFLYVHNLRFFARDVGANLRRLFFFALLAQPAIAWSFGRLATPLNILFTLLIGAVVVAVLEAARGGRLSRGWAALAVSCALVLSFGVEYGLPGVLMVVALARWVASGRGRMLAVAAALAGVANGGGVWGLLAFAFVLALPLLLRLPLAARRLPRLFFYIYYPLHALALRLVALLP